MEIDRCPRETNSGHASTVATLRALLMLGAGTVVFACRTTTSIGSGSSEVPTNPCPTKETLVLGSDTQPVMVHVGRLELPPDVRRQLKGAYAIVEVLVDSRGRPVPCTVKVFYRTDPRLTEAARALIIESRFRPAKSGAQPIPAWVNVPVRVT
jgi:hypothetical protein